MSLFSMAYITNQYRGRVYQIETKSPEVSPKPIYLKPLTLVSEEVLGAIQTRSGMSNWIFRSGASVVSSTVRGTLNHRFGQPQRDKFHLLRPVKHLFGIPALR